MSIPPEVTAHYNKLKADYAEIFKRYIELEEERRENSLVLSNVEVLKGDRRCWKVVGGVLVEHTLPQTLQSLRQHVTMLEQALGALNDEMGKRQKEVLDIELKYNMSPSKKQDVQ